MPLLREMVPYFEFCPTACNPSINALRFAFRLDGSDYSFHGTADGMDAKACLAGAKVHVENGADQAVEVWFTVAG